MSGRVLLERAGGVARITIDNHARKNALTFAMTRELIAHLEELSSDNELRVVLLRGLGTDFCSGADVADLAVTLGQSPEERAAEFSRGVDEMSSVLLRSLRAIRQPIVVSIRGYTIGVAVQFVLAADLVVASDTARFVLPQIRLGHTLDHGESWLLPRRIGLSRALQLSLLGEHCRAHDAERYGLANWVVPDDDLEAKTDEIVEKLTGFSPTALFGNKALLLANSEQSDLDTALLTERDQVARCAAAEDFVEALTAFQEKRRPRFVGR